MSVQRDSVVVTVDSVVADFRHWLACERALSPATVECYGRQARSFLSRLPAPLEQTLAQLDAAQVMAFMLDFCPERNTWSAKAMVTSLRAVLRFLHVSGRTRVALAGAVPAVSGWRLASLPRGIDAATVAQIVAGCDRGTALGRRNYAVVIMLVRLGLRSVEVTRLRLGDFDWRAGEVTVHGKGGRVDRLPVPVEVGDAVTAYLTAGRPVTESRAVFCGLRPPFGPLAACTISTIVGHACDRAGVERVFAHRLRHSLATDLLRAGASLPEIGQVLRHRDIASTSIYAKVDVEALRPLARPWPTGVL
ncbi:site-specific integrase [Nocardia sp. NBC_00565]|uniref:site-specific integrase n=1 Tax=Nocardia sp. NBC_00565 TaxID=2975993 RepID=UPI002E822156|nr:site-specific integrase [Nocardia sp. NBC_00565]WUC06873.1 site-specific integrase [Nocardia sp. NBC_00565]